MNTKRMLWSICLCLLVPCSALAQMNEEEGWFNSFGEPSAPVLIPVPTNSFQLNYRLSGISGDSLAEAITPDIQALARGLENDPQKIFDYVHERIRYVHYFGSKKGAQLTLLEGSGNEFDQCALLISLLRAAGYTNASYQFGGQKVPYERADHRDFQHWQGLSMPNTNWNNSYFIARLFSQARGYPDVYDFQDSTNFAIHRLWVKLPLNGTNYLLDPAFRVSEPATGVDLVTASGISSNGLWTTAAGTVTANYVQSLGESAVRNQLRDWTTNLLAYLRSNVPNASVEEVLGGWRVTTTNSQPLTTQTTWPEINSANFPTTEWNNIPTNWMSKMTISFGNSNLAFNVPELQGRRLSMIFTNGQSQLWLDDEIQLQRTNVLTGDKVNVTLSIDHPHNDYNAQTATWFDRTYHDQSKSGLYRTNGVYAIIYAFEASSAQLRKRQTKLDAYRQQGLADTSREVMSETLNVIGQSWLLQTEMAARLLGSHSGALPQHHHRFGRMAYEPASGYYVDVYLQFSGNYPSSGITAADYDRSQRMFEVSSYFASAMEHGVIEQLQSSNLIASSTVKMLQLANANGTAIYLATSNNWSAVAPALVGYDLNYWLGKVNEGRRLLLPQNGQIQIAGAGSWKGYGVVDKLNISGANSMGMLIDGRYQGGYAAFPYSVPSPSYVSSWNYSAPTYFNVAPPSLPPISAADPVNMVDGSFMVSAGDLAVGQTEPRGLSFARDYSSSRRFHNLTGLGEGWTHNYFINLAEVSASQPALGETTPAQMAAMLVATRAAFDFHTTAATNAKHWAVTALVAKWGVDQLRSNAVSITLGSDALQFVKQPDGQWTPPAGSTMTLLKTNSVYWLQERQGRTFKFDGSGRLTNLVDQYNQSLNISYLAATSNLPQTVTDWKGRSLTFTYNGTPQRLASVADSTGRSVSYGYTANGGRLDLTSVTDPENKTHTFQYDTNHQIIAARDAANRLVTTNIFDGFGRVVTQLTEGDPNKTWQLYWSGFVNVEQNPAGSKRRYSYDDKHRNVALEDALGNMARMVYDGQDHTLMTVSPLNETNRSEYDGSHNLLRSIDPLGFTNRFYYDSQHRLTRSEDARGVTNRFGYNTQHSLTGSTNGAGDWATAIYNADGTTLSRSDAGGTTTYGYDAFGQVNGVTYPGGLGGESFANHPRGDVTNHTNARGFVTSFQYNQRRELTNTIAPTNLTARVVFDAVGNVQSTTDARGFTGSHTWSATRRLLATALPVTPQGTPVVTNVYDSRDWLLRSISNPQSTVSATVSYTNDTAGRLMAGTDPLLRTVRFGYDADGRKLTATNAALEVSRQFWNARGELTKAVDGASNAVLRAYDAAGNQITLTNRNGQKWQFQFDAANRLTNTLTPLNRQTQITYNNRGLVSTVREPSGQTLTNFYDAKGRLTNRVDAVTSTLLRYDANNNVTNLVENGTTNAWTFDAYDQVSNYRDADGNSIQYRHDANGNLTNLIYPGNRVVAYAYDSLNRLTNVTDWVGRPTRIEYDLASQVKKITRPNGTVRTIDYDVAGQTTNLWERLTNGTPLALFKFNWNNAARVAWEFAAPLPHAYTPPTRTMTFDEDNRPATFNGQNVVNDTDGNMTSGPLTNNTFATHTYDARNRLLGAGGLSCGYDPAGNRTAITNGANVTRFVINPNAALSQVLMRVRPGVTNYYVYGLGLQYEITETATTTNTLTYHYDYRGSTVALTDSSGNVTDRVEYSPYATTTYRSGTNDTPFLYNGRYGVQTDPNTLLYMRARFYNPYLCRFLNADPSGFSGGLNFYAFADGNPVSMIDPFGLGAMALGVPSWMSSTRNDIIRDQFMAAYHQTQAQMAAAYSGGYRGGGMTGGQALSAVLNFLPGVGAVKGFVELNTGRDAVTGQWHGRSDASLVTQVVLASIIAPPARAAAGGGLAAERSPVFWSGGRAAEDAARTFANANNGIVIGDTAAGRALAQSTAGVPWSQARPQWQSLSESFARTASGEVNVFQNARGVSVDSIWRNEYQILRQNNVQINFNVVMPNGSVAPVP